MIKLIITVHIQARRPPTTTTTHTNVFVGLLQFRQNSQTIFDHSAGPLVHFLVLICIATDRRLNGLFNNFTHIVHDKLILQNIEKKYINAPQTSALQ